MKSKLVCATLCIAFLSIGNVYGNFNCPDLQNWDGKSDIGEWKVAKVKGTTDTWYASNAWILEKTRYFPELQAQCNYVSSDYGVTAKVTFGRVIDPTKYTFKGPSYIKQYPSGNTIGWGCSPWKNDVKMVNKYPEDCEFIGPAS